MFEVSIRMQLGKLSIRMQPCKLMFRMQLGNFSINMQLLDCRLQVRVLGLHFRLDCHLCHLAKGALCTIERKCSVLTLQDKREAPLCIARLRIQQTLGTLW